MRRFLTLLLSSSLVLAACGGGDDGPSAADEQKDARAAIDAFEAAAREEGFEVDPEADDDEGTDLEFRSEECRELEEVLGDDDEDLAGQTADVESDDFVLAQGDAEETVDASMVVADADALQEQLDVMDDDQVASCIEEAMTLSFEKLGAEQDIEMQLTDFVVDVESPDLGDSAVLVHATGTIDAAVLQLPFTFEVLAVRDGRRGATVTHAVFGAEPTGSAETFMDALLGATASA